MISLPAVIYLETDKSKEGVYDFRKPHLDTAQALGWVRIVIMENNHPRKSSIAKECDFIITLNTLSVSTISPVLKELENQYELKVIFSYPGQTVPNLDINSITEKLCQEFNLPSPPSIAIKSCNNKFVMRNILKSAEIKSVNSKLINSNEDLLQAASELGFPLVFKSVFGAGSALIKKCNNIDELITHYKYFTKYYKEVASSYHFGGNTHIFTTPDGQKYQYEPGHTAMIEEYIEGPEFTIECAVYEDKPIPILMHEKLLVSYESSTILEHLLITPPNSLNENDVEIAMQYCIDCIAALGLKRSFVHFEFRQTPSGPSVIEINPRIGGFYVFKSLKEIAELDPFAVSLAMWSGSFNEDLLNLAQDTAAKNRKGYTMFVIYPPKPGKLLSLNGALDVSLLPNIRDYQILPTGRNYDCYNEEEFIAKFWGVAENKQQAKVLHESVCSILQATMW